TAKIGSKGNPGSRRRLMEATVRAVCPNCKMALRIPAQWVGQAVKCKKCGAQVRVKAKEEAPAPDDTAPATPLPPAAAAPVPAPPAIRPVLPGALPRAGRSSAAAQRVRLQPAVGRRRRLLQAAGRRARSGSGSATPPRRQRLPASARLRAPAGLPVPAARLPD